MASENGERAGEPRNLFEERHAARVVADPAYRAMLLERVRSSRVVVADVRRQSNSSGFYIGRFRPGLKGSPLANPYRIGVDGTRDEVLAAYRTWLDARLAPSANTPTSYTQQLSEIVRLAEIYIDRGALTLLCFCAPRPCHGDYLAQLIRERAVLIVENEGQ
jgi:hypothetical protein